MFISLIRLILKLLILIALPGSISWEEILSLILAGDQSVSLHGPWRLPHLDYPPWFHLPRPPRRQLLRQPHHLQPLQLQV